MKRWIARIWQMALAAFVVASLGVGVAQLQATARVLDHCPPEMPDHCSSNQDCDPICQPMGGVGRCLNSCCQCLF